MPDFRHIKSAGDKGFTLIELSVFLMIAGLILSMSLDVYWKYVQYKRYEHTKAQLLEAVEAVREYYFLNSRFPCPAPASDNIVHELYLREMDCKSIFESGKLSGYSTKSNDYVLLSGENDRIVIAGYLPVYDLTVSDKQGIDAWGRHLRYSVTLSLASNAGYEQEPGAITILNQDEKSINWKAGGAQYAVYSSGANGCGSEGIDQKNCFFEAASKHDKAEIHKGLFSLQPGPAYFDDIIMFEERAKYPQNAISPPCNCGE